MLSQSLAPFTFESIKTEFSVYQIARDSLISLNVFRSDLVDDGLIHLRSNLLLAVLLYCLNHVKLNITQLLNNNMLLINDEIKSLINNIMFQTHEINRFSTTDLNELNVYIEAINDVYKSSVCYYCFIDVFKLMIKCLNDALKLKKNINVQLFVILAYHEVFDSFLRATFDVLMNINNDLSILTLYDDDLAAYHKIKSCVMPRGTNAHALITQFILPPFGYEFNHQIQDLQVEEIDFIDTKKQVFINVYNDILFYSRLLPTNWAHYNNIDLLKNNGVNLTSISRRIKSLINH